MMLCLEHELTSTYNGFLFKYTVVGQALYPINGPGVKLY